MIVAIESLKRNSQNLNRRRKGMQAIYVRRFFKTADTSIELDGHTYPKDYNAYGEPINLKKSDIIVLSFLALSIIAMIVYLS